MKNAPTILLFTFMLSLQFIGKGICDTNDISLELRNGAIVKMAEKNQPPPEESGEFSVYDRFVKLKSINIQGLVYTYNNKQYKLDWDQMVKTIEYIDLMDPDISPYKDGKMALKKLTGKKITVPQGTFLKYIGYHDALSEINILEFDSYHKFWREKYLDIKEVKRIRLHKKEKVAKKTAKDLNFATTKKEIVSSLSKPKYNKKKGGGVNLNIEFDFDSHKIRKSSYPLLNELGRALSDKKLAKKNILIKGHTDSTGPKSYNQQLSLRRARSVRTYLVSKFGIRPSRLTTAGYGETIPLVPNTSKANRQINRRVEIRANR